MAHILLPTDFSDGSLNACAYALDLFGTDGNTFTLVHSYIDPVPGYTSTAGDDVALALSNVTERDNMDLVVVLHRHMGILEGLFHGSITKHLAMHTRIPLLVLEH